MASTIAPALEAERQEAIEDLQDQLQDNEPWDEFVAHHMPGAFGFHEAVHGAAMSLAQFNQFVVNHPSVILDPRLYGRANAVMNAMAEFYQMAADIHFDEQPTGRSDA